MIREDKDYRIELAPMYKGLFFSILKHEEGKVHGHLLSFPEYGGVPHHYAYVEDTQQEVFEKAKRDILRDYSSTRVPGMAISQPKHALCH